MLDKFIKKYLSSKEDNTPASAEHTKEVEMTVEQKTTADAMAAQLKEAQETLTSQAADLEALTDLVAEMSGKFEKAQEALAASEAVKADLVTKAATARLEARTKAITESVGTSQLTVLLAATDAMADEQFNTIVGAMAKSFAVEAKSEMFTEKGVAAESTHVETTAVSRLAAKIAEEFKSE